MLKAAAVLLALAAVAAAQPTSVLEVLETNKQLSGLFDYVGQYPDIVSMLGPDFSGTLFAPSNSALKAGLAALKEAGKTINEKLIKDLILYAMVPGPPGPITSLNDDQIFSTSLGGQPTKVIVVQYTDGKLTLKGIGSDAGVVDADIMVGPAQYAAVHVIDTLLLPFELPTGTLTASKPAPKPAKGDAADADATGTVGAASLVSGNPTTETRAEPTDGTAMPYGPSTTAPEATAEPIAMPINEPEPVNGKPVPISETEGEAVPIFFEPETVLDAAMAANLTSLVGAIRTAGLESLFGPDFAGTVFAPTNEAFEAALAAATAGGMDITPEVVAELLKYHVVNGTAAFSGDLEDGQVLETLAGITVTVVLRDGGVFLEDAAGNLAAVVTADVEVGDAVVHVIDAVLVPMAMGGAPAPAPSEPVSGASSMLASLAALGTALLAGVLAM